MFRQNYLNMIQDIHVQGEFFSLGICWRLFQQSTAQKKRSEIKLDRNNKNASCYFEQVLQAALYKIVVVRQFTSKLSKDSIRSATHFGTAVEVKTN